MSALIAEIANAKFLLSESTRLKDSQKSIVAEVIANRLLYLATNPFKIDTLESFVIDLTFEAIPDVKNYCKIQPRDIWHKEQVGGT